jgi:hypothetical protein
MARLSAGARIAAHDTPQSFLAEDYDIARAPLSLLTLVNICNYGPGATNKPFR